MKTKNVIISAAAIIAVTALATGASKVKNLSDKFKADTGTPSNISAKGGRISFNLPISINNQSSFDVTLQNLYVTIQNRDLNGNWEDLFIQNNAVREAEIKKLVTSRLPVIPLNAGFAKAATIVNILSGQQSRELKVIIRFEILNYEISPIEFTVNATTLLAPFRAMLKSFGLLKGIDGLGYQDNSVHYRKIKPGNQYNHLFPKSKGLVHYIASDANPTNTVVRMAQIVNETIYQTEKLAPLLKGNNLKQTCNNIYDFLYNHIQYNRDAEHEEQLREPARSWDNRTTGIDCDCFSIFASSILTNLGIAHDIKAISVRPDKALQHVYVTVPNNEGTYYTIDACVHQFNTEPKNITNQILQPMITTRLSGLEDEIQTIPLDGLEGYLNAYASAKTDAEKNNISHLGATKCISDTGYAVNTSGAIVIHNYPAKSNKCGCANNDTGIKLNPQTGKLPVVRKSQKIRAFNQTDKAALTNITLEPLRAMLLHIRNQVQKNPDSIAHLYNPQEFINSTNNVLNNWNSPVQRKAVLATAKNNENKIANNVAANQRRTQKNRWGLLPVLNGIEVDPVNSFPIFGLSKVDEENLVINGFGGFFAGLESLINSSEHVINSVIDYSNTELTNNNDLEGLEGLGRLKKLKNKVQNAGKKVANTVKKTATTVVKAAQKINPAMVAGRTAYRGLVALNFRGWATTMKRAIDQGKSGPIKQRWTSTAIGGNWGDLVSAINTGAKKKAILGELSEALAGLGEPATIAASIAAATPIIVAFEKLIRDLNANKNSAAQPESTANEQGEDLQLIERNKHELPTPSSRVNPPKPGRQNGYINMPPEGYLIWGAAIFGGIYLFRNRNRNNQNKPVNGLDGTKAKTKTKTIETIKL